MEPTERKSCTAPISRAGELIPPGCENFSAEELFLILGKLDSENPTPKTCTRLYDTPEVISDTASISKL